MAGLINYNMVLSFYGSVIKLGIIDFINENRLFLYAAMPKERYHFHLNVCYLNYGVAEFFPTWNIVYVQFCSQSKLYLFVSDEAIDLTIIVGQQILCRVTHVDSINKFYVQLDLDKATLVDNAIASFDTAKVSKISWY